MQVNLPEKFESIFKPKRWKIFYGGRGGAKTVSFSKALLILAAQEQKRILCTREFLNSIDESVHSSLKEEITNLSLSHLFSFTNNKIIGSNGSLITYSGLARNLSSIKSKNDIDIVWIEEAETVSEKSLSVLKPTIRKDGSEIWVSFNPDDEFSPIYEIIKPYLDTIEKQGFYEDDEMYICKVNLEDNPFAPQVLLDQSAKMKKENYKEWLHIWGGYVYGDYSESIIQPEWFAAAIDAHLKLNFQAMGVKSLGFDPADSGKDAKAIVQRYGSVITHASQWHDGELPEAIDRTFDFAYENRIEHIVYDADGLGVGVKVGLKDKIEGKNIVVTPYRGNGKIPNPLEIYKEDKSNQDTFKNARAYWHWSLRDRFEATYNAIVKGIYTDPINMISISSEIEDLGILKSEAIKVQRKKGQNSFIQIESKEDMKKRGLKSPNLFDSLVMSFANPPPQTKVPVLNFETDF